MAHAKKIGLATAIIVSMNAMIGAGIFSVPSALGSLVGPAALLTYVIVIGAVWCMGGAMARLAQHYPQEGSFYTYARQWGGHYVGLLAAGLYFLGLIIGMGHLTHTMGLYLTHYFPGLSAFGLGAIVLIFLTLLNVIGVKLSQWGQFILIGATLFPLAAITFLCLTHGSASNFVPFIPFGWHSIFAATRVVIFGFFGFECAASLFNVLENPQKNIPKALVWSIILVGLLYMAFVGSIIFAIPLSAFLDESLPLSTILGQRFPEHTWLFEVIHFSIFGAIFGTVHSMIWAAGSLVSSFIRQLYHYKNSTRAAVSIIVIKDYCAVLMVGTAIMISYVLFNDPNLFFSLTAVCVMLAFILSMLSLVVKNIPHTSLQRVQTYVGLATACLIVYFALEDIVLLMISRLG